MLKVSEAVFMGDIGECCIYKYMETTGNSIRYNVVFNIRFCFTESLFNGVQVTTI